MKLYHGTSNIYTSQILKEGLIPRSTRTNGNWEEYVSREDLVYLTTAYPWFFATHTSAAVNDRDTKAVVFEIDSALLHESSLLPDEDFLSQVVAANQGVPLVEIHNETRDNIEGFAAVDGTPLWQLSLAMMGTCSHKGAIPPSAITRYCVLDFGERPLLSAMAYNEGPHLTGPHERHRHLTKWMFGDKRTLPHFVPEGFLACMEHDKFYRYFQNPNWKAEEQSRFGVEVFNTSRSAA
jgi:hypothetical protein